MSPSGGLVGSSIPTTTAITTTTFVPVVVGLVLIEVVVVLVEVIVEVVVVAVAVVVMVAVAGSSGSGSVCGNSRSSILSLAGMVVGACSSRRGGGSRAPRSWQQS